MATGHAALNLRRRRAVPLAIMGLLAAAAACSPRADGLRVGDAPPREWSDDGTGRPVVAWVMKGDDYLGCATAAGDLRKLQRRYGDRVRVALLYVGDDPGLVAGVMRRERLSAELHALSASEFRKTYGEVKIPAFFVAHQGRVTARALSPNGAAPPPGARDQVDHAVRAALGS